MLHSPFGDLLHAVFIHDVRPMATELRSCEAPNGTVFDYGLRNASDPRIWTGQTHVDAAAWALRKGLIACCFAGGIVDAVESWVACRCDGQCSAEDRDRLPKSGARRNETVAYCALVRTDLAALRAQVATSCSEAEVAADCLWAETRLGNGVDLPGAAARAGPFGGPMVVALAVCAGLYWVLDREQGRS